MYLTYCKRALIKSFRKQGFNHHYDFSYIFSTTNDAVNYILKANMTNLDLDMQLPAFDIDIQHPQPSDTESKADDNLSFKEQF